LVQGVAYQTKVYGGLGWGSIPKISDFLLIIYATIEASNFKFGIQLQFGE